MNEITAARRGLSALLATAALFLLPACSDDDDPTGPRVVIPEVVAIREATAVGAAGIQATVDAFRADLGDPNNGNAVGSQAAGRRHITWDGGDNDAAPALLPADFYNAVAPRGAIVGGDDPRLQFQVSADASNATGTPAEFGNINATYPTAFATFSSPRLFSALNSNVFEIRFHVPGSFAPAYVGGAGVVFTDVDVAGSTRLEFLAADGTVVFGRDILTTPGNGGLSFLGVTFDAAAIAALRITAGDAALGPNDITQSGTDDIVVIDDVIYGEPVP